MMELQRSALPIFLMLFAIQLCSSNPIFYESFEEPFEKSWTISQKDGYTGLWKHSKSEGHEDFGLLVSEKARKYAIVKPLEKPVDLNDKTIVLQYEARFQEGLECGGAYLKFLKQQDASWTPKDFDSDSPYSIMFGPDKCGSTNKVHFILRHKNPKTSVYVEHHLKHPPSVPYDKLSHVYTAVIKPDNELQILIDGDEKKKANFLKQDDFEPALVPSKTIPDPDDKKPEDWDDRAKIPDVDAVKPDDWDEYAPMEVEDGDAVKPEGWLDDELEEVDDPVAAKPEDWDDEEDGEWEAPKIENPRCAKAPGCGEWRRPTKRNPAYKGKWHAPSIDNPRYKGIWKPSEIPNPAHFEIDKPDFEPISAVGIEIWTMQDGILFDNVLITSDEKVAQSYRVKAWKPKYDAEKEKEKKLEDNPPVGLSGYQKTAFDALYRVADVPFLKSYRTRIIAVIEKGEKQPNLAIGVVVSFLLIIVTIIFRIAFSRKKAVQPTEEITAAAVPSSVETTEDKTENGGTAGTEKEEDEEKEKEDAGPARPRRSRRET